MQLYLLLVSQHLNPGSAVGVRPHGIVDASEIGGELATSLAQEIRQQYAHFIVSQGILGREEQFIPHLRRSRLEIGRWRELVPAIGSGSPGRANAAGQHREEPQ